MIEVRDIHKELGEFSLRGVSLRVETGEYFTVLGPTGAGKTVLLECIAGIHKAEKGEVWLEGRNVTHLPPELRRVAYVPQDYVLFPHMSLRANIEFSLTLARVPRDKIDKRVRDLTTMLRIDGLLERRPRTLSGGEQQRGALARALAPEPVLMLLDEPLSALDEGTRAELMPELDRISHELGTTVIHVTHSFEEALELGDRMALLRAGRIIQTGTPSEVLRRPASEFIARFVGCANLFAVSSADSAAGTATVDGDVTLRVREVLADGDRLVAIRPEDVQVAPGAPRAGGDTNTVPARFTRVDDRGRTVRLTLEGPLRLQVAMTRQAFQATGVSVGDQVVATFPAEAAHMLER
jgi:ABC-type Fe3+/spermidine/putrescine transport system ATPase subunit